MKSASLVRNDQERDSVLVETRNPQNPHSQDWFDLPRIKCPNSMMACRIGLYARLDNL